MKKSKQIVQALILSLAMLATWMLPLFGNSNIDLPVEAVSVDYPVQLMNIAPKDNSTVLTENGTTDGTTLSLKALGSDLSCSWRFDRVGFNSVGTFFKLTNAQSGRLRTPSNYNVSAGTSFNEGATYRIKNTNSGLYMQVAGALPKTALMFSSGSLPITAVRSGMR